MRTHGPVSDDETAFEQKRNKAGAFARRPRGVGGMTASLVNAARVTAWILACVIIVLSLVPPWLRPESGAPHNVEHFAIYCAAGLAFGIGYSRKPLAVMAALVLFAGMIELAQLLVPGRHARLGDFVVDALALCAGVGFIYLLVARSLHRA
jgi:hypothetical protein